MKVESNKIYIFFLCIILFILFLMLTFKTYTYDVILFLLILSMCTLVLITARSFLIGFTFNTLFLIVFPAILYRISYIIINENYNRKILFVVIFMFISMTVNFFIMAYKIKSKYSVPNFFQKHMSNFSFKNTFTSFMIKIVKYQSFYKISTLFIQYIALLYCILYTFAILYTYLGNVFHEGIESETNIISSWDSLYFSATTFFTIGFGDITPHKYSEMTKIIVIIQAIMGHLITTVFWPIMLIFAFGKREEK